MSFSVNEGSINLLEEFMKTYRIAILGCRGRGTTAARAYNAHPRTEIVGLCDLIEERRNALGKEVNVSARYDDLDEMIQDTSPDIVAIPTATELHYDLSMRVLDHGVNIEVEKPMCVDLIQADAVITKAEEQSVQVAVHHQGRVGASHRAIAAAFDAGKIGDLRYMYGSGKGYYGGYGLMNIGTHMLNNMLHFGKRCESVFAQLTTGGKPITTADVVPSPSGMGTIAGEYITATMQYEGNVTGTLLQHRFGKMDTNAYTMELFGTEGRLFWSSNSAWYLPTPHYIPDGTLDKWESLDLIYPEHYDKKSSASIDDYWFVEEYVNALDEKRPHTCSGYEGRHIIEMMMGIFESAAYESRVDLPQEDRRHPLLRWREAFGLKPPEEMPRGYGEWLGLESSRINKFKS